MRRPRYRDDIAHELVGHIIACLIEAAVADPDHPIHHWYGRGTTEQALMTELMIAADQIDHRGWEASAARAALEGE